MSNNTFIIRPRRTGAYLALGLIATPFVVHGTVGWFRTGRPAARATSPDAPDRARDNLHTDVPERIITIGPNAAEVICALGACERIIAVDKFCVFPAELRNRPRVGGLFDPDLERMVALKPDLLILRGRSETVEQLARERGIDLYFDETDTIDGIETCIRDIARVLGTESAGEHLVREFRERIDAIRKRIDGRPRPRVLVTLSRQPDRLANLLTAGKGNFTDEMIAIAGGLNMFGDQDMSYPQVSTESVIARRPDVILEMMPELTLTPELESAIREQWASLGSLPALANERLHIITDENCQIPSPRYVDVIEKVSRLLHPEAWDE